MLVSVIIPVFNGQPALTHCLQALFASDAPPWECIVVDDGSTDGSDNIAVQFGARLLHTTVPQSGPAVARNIGARAAAGEILFFLDADILVQPTTIAQVARLMSANPTWAALFGSYDAAPTAVNFLSQYRNLLHHYTHQISSANANTFWSGCGAIRRTIFLEMGGFDSDRFPRPSIEDIELGYRLRQAGYHIHLEKSQQVGHMKRWTVQNIVTTDIRDRALPWTKLILESGPMLNDLNLQSGQRLSGIAAVFGLGLLPLGLKWRSALLGTLLAAAVLWQQNYPFYRFLQRQRGTPFMLQALPWHWLYFVYSSLSFGLMALWQQIRLRSSPTHGA